MEGRSRFRAGLRTRRPKHCSARRCAALPRAAGWSGSACGSTASRSPCWPPSLTPPGAFSYKTAFDERYARFSPGVLLQRENLAMLERPEYRLDRQLCRGGPPDDRPLLARAAGDRPGQHRHRRHGAARAVPPAGDNTKPDVPQENWNDRDRHNDDRGSAGAERLSLRPRARLSPRIIPKCRTCCGTSCASTRCWRSTRSPRWARRCLRRRSNTTSGDLPIGVDGKPGSNGMTIGETIRQHRHQRQLGGAQEHRAGPGICRAARRAAGRTGRRDRRQDRPNAQDAGLHLRLQPQCGDAVPLRPRTQYPAAARRHRRK